jgi:hypothetical protein
VVVKNAREDLRDRDRNDYETETPRFVWTERSVSAKSKWNHTARPCLTLGKTFREVCADVWPSGETPVEDVSQSLPEQELPEEAMRLSRPRSSGNSQVGRRMRRSEWLKHAADASRGRKG